MSDPADPDRPAAASIAGTTEGGAVPPAAPAAGAEAGPEAGTEAGHPVAEPAEEIGGPKGPEPTRFGDWERKGRCIDF